MKTIIYVEFHYGKFVQREQDMPLESCPSKKVTVIKTEEKQSDVNLAVHMLNDAWLNLHDCSVLVSNDSDIVTSMKLIGGEPHPEKGHPPKKKIGLFTPGKKPSRELEKYSNFMKKINSKTLLEKCQLPDEIPGKNIHKPELWY